MIPHKETVEFLAKKLHDLLEGGEAHEFTAQVSADRTIIFLTFVRAPRPNLNPPIPKKPDGMLIKIDDAQKLLHLLETNIKKAGAP